MGGAPFLPYGKLRKSLQYIRYSVNINKRPKGYGAFDYINKGVSFMARITVEDCLEKVPSRFSLVHLASQRARQLIKGANALVESENEAIVTALREIAAGEVLIEEEEKGKKK
jgi:DNA-directed RNA polymerase subunit omega